MISSPQTLGKSLCLASTDPAPPEVRLSKTSDCYDLLIPASCPTQVPDWRLFHNTTECGGGGELPVTTTPPPAVECKELDKEGCKVCTASDVCYFISSEVRSCLTLALSFLQSQGETECLATTDPLPPKVIYEITASCHSSHLGGRLA